MSDCHARDPGLILGRDNRCLAFFHLLHNQNILSIYGWIRVSLREHLRTHATFIEDQIIIDFLQYYNQFSIKAYVVARVGKMQAFMSKVHVTGVYWHFPELSGIFWHFQKLILNRH